MLQLQQKLAVSILSYGLSAGIADINGDGWPDIYISNDYGVPDYLYINNKNGTFTNELQNCFRAYLSIFNGQCMWQILIMMPCLIFLRWICCLKITTGKNYYSRQIIMERFNVLLKSGFYYQYMRNMLHINNGNNTFSEIGQFAGISNTDWSWSPLFADFDNDGWKDLFVTNGYLRDYTNMDFIKYMNDITANKGAFNTRRCVEYCTADAIMQCD